MIKLDFLTDYDVHLFGEAHTIACMTSSAAHVIEQGGQRGTHFGVWAPSAAKVSVVGDFNDGERRHSVRGRCQSGLWTGFVSLWIKELSAYKYHITQNNGMQPSERSDPFGFTQKSDPNRITGLGPG